MNIEATGRDNMKGCRGAQSVMALALTIVFITCSTQYAAARPNQESEKPRISNALAYSLPGMDKVEVRHESYRAGKGHDLTADIFYPPSIGPKDVLPVVVFAMGFRDSSTFVGGPVKDLPQIRAWGRLVAASGLIGVTYRTEQADDLEALTAFLRAHAATLRMDPERIGLWACSGNSPTAMSFAMQEGRTFLKCAVFYYGFLLTPDNFLRTEINALLGEKEAYAAELKDIKRLRADLPLLVVKCGADSIPYVNKTIDHFAAAAKAEGVPMTFIEYEKGIHAFDVAQKEPKQSGEIIKQTLDFLKAKLIDR
jgi:dienelactone hydrolase